MSKPLTHTFSQSFEEWCTANRLSCQCTGFKHQAQCPMPAAYKMWQGLGRERYKALFANTEASNITPPIQVPPTKNYRSYISS